MNKKVFSLTLFLCVIFALCFTSCKNNNNSENATTTSTVSTTESGVSKTKKTVIVYVTQTTDKQTDLNTTKDKPSKVTKPSAVKTSAQTSASKTVSATNQSGTGNTGYTDENGDHWTPTY